MPIVAGTEDKPRANRMNITISRPASPYTTASQAHNAAIRPRLGTLGTSSRARCIPSQSIHC